MKFMLILALVIGYLGAASHMAVAPSPFIIVWVRPTRNSLTSTIFLWQAGLFRAMARLFFISADVSPPLPSPWPPPPPPPRPPPPPPPTAHGARSLGAAHSHSPAPPYYRWQRHSRAIGKVGPHWRGIIVIVTIRVAGVARQACSIVALSESWTGSKTVVSFPAPTRQHEG